MINRVTGKQGLIFGDLHLDDVYEGKHLDYVNHWTSVLNTIRKLVYERKPAFVALLGDISGVPNNIVNIRNREIFSMVCRLFMDIKEICPIYAIRGNHDFGAYPDFDFLQDLGIIETSQKSGGYFDFFGEGGSTETPEIRFHLLDYGSEYKHLETLEGVSNVVLFHNNITIKGLSNWYQAIDGIELATLLNFENVCMAIGGHIHRPAPEVITTTLSCGGECMLYYPGCPTMPTLEDTMYTDANFVVFEYDIEANTTNFDSVPLNLPELDKIFNLTDTFLEDLTVEDIEDVERMDDLRLVLNDMLKYRMASGDIVAQIQAISSASDKAKEVAIGYYEVAMGMKMSMEQKSSEDL